jgi:sialidase-1
MRTRIIIAACLAAVCGLVLAQSEWDFGIGQKDQVTKGLVSYWSMRNSGTTVYDEIGANTGTAAGDLGFAYTNGLVGDGASFGGVNSKVTVNDSDNLSFVSGATDTPFTFSVWAKYSVTNNQYLLMKGSAVASLEYALYFDGNAAIRVYMYDVANDAYIGRDKRFAAGDYKNAWTHFVATYSGSGLASGFALYANCVRIDATNFASGSYSHSYNSNGVLGVGARLLAGSEDYFTGSLDEVRVYNRALELGEIKQLYRMGAIPRGTK